MSELFDDEDPRRQAPPPPQGPSRRSRALLITAGVVVVGFFVLTAFAALYTERLWFTEIGFSQVFTTLLWTRVLLFVVFALLMALIVGVNMAIAYRFRPTFRASTPEQSNLDRYRSTVAPIRRLLLVGVAAAIGVFAGTSALGQWRTYLMWRNGTDFGTDDAYFGRDIGFFVFDLPWLHFVVDFLMAAAVVSVVVAAVVHYLYGGIRLQVSRDRISGAAQVQLSVLLGVFVLAKAGDYYLDRFDLVTQDGTLFTGMHNTSDTAVRPARDILIFIAIICALLFFANVWRRTWQLPTLGLALMVLSSILMGMIWPAIVQQFQVKPSEPIKERDYIAANIDATLQAYELDDVEPEPYQSSASISGSNVRAVANQVSSVPLVDPQLVRRTFQQRQQARNYYSVAPVLDVDRYEIDGVDRALVLGARELDQSGINDADQNWSNLHTVYTHGDGLIAAYANQRPQDNRTEQSVSTEDEAGLSNETADGAVWAEGIEANQKDLSELEEYQSKIYYGEQSPSYSIVGKPDEVADDVELGLAGTQTDQTTTYTGEGGVPVGGFFNQLMYAVKYGEANFLLSSRVNDSSKLLYDRQPRERVQKVAPWLTLDGDPYPAIVDGKVLWIVDGYTTTDRYPNAQRESFDVMTDDSLQDVAPGFATLPTDEINYMRNAVKATVDAYDGTVTLYAWDEEDPILQAWQGVFPGTVEPASAISDELREHLRYPEDLFKVQRYQYARYHVTDPGQWYQGNNRWEVPMDPNADSSLQPPYRLFTGEDGAEPAAEEETGESAGEEQTDGSSTDSSRPGKVWSLTSVFVPFQKENLASFVSVNSDATSPNYGEMTVLELQDPNTPGPGIIANEFSQDEGVVSQLLPYRGSGSPPPVFGNLLTLPVNDGLIYIEPIYAQRSSSESAYPILQFVTVSYGNRVGIDTTLTGALADAFGVTDIGQATGGGGGSGGGGNGGATTGQGSGGDGGSPGAGATGSIDDQIVAKLQQAQTAFDAADQALADGNTVRYARQVQRAQGLIADATALVDQRDSGSADSAGAGDAAGSSAGSEG